MLFSDGARNPLHPLSDATAEDLLARAEQHAVWRGITAHWCGRFYGTERVTFNSVVKAMYPKEDVR